MFNIFKRKKIEKTFVPAPTQTSVSASVASVLGQQSLGFEYLTVEKMISAYLLATPVANGVDMISNTMSNIELKLFDKKSNTYIDNAPILDLMNDPNELPNSSYCNFISDICRFYLVTGNSFIIMTLSSRMEPMELYCIPTQLIEYELGSDGYVYSYTYTPQGGGGSGISTVWGQSVTFTRTEDFRYLNRDKTQQLLHIKDFQPNGYRYNSYGASRLNAAYYEITQYSLSAIHNTGILTTGARPSAIFNMKDDMSIEQQQAMRAEIENIFSGASNAGRSIITSMLESVNLLTTSNVDMDFRQINAMISDRIYNRLRIPLALINPNGLSLANMETARLNLYDFAILPDYRNFLEFFTKNILYKYYGDDKNLALTYNPFTIDALKERSLDETKKMAQFNVMSDNEIRDRIDLRDYSGGDEIWKPTNYAPSGATDDNNRQPSGSNSTQGRE